MVSTTHLKALLCGAVLVVTLAPARAQYVPPQKPRPQPRQTSAPTTPQFQKTGIAVNRETLYPGIDLQTLFGVVGPPDHVDAVRGKEQPNDYVRFNYASYGFYAHVKTVNNQDNVVESLVILQNNVKLNGVPFKVGDDYRLVQQAWGTPDQTEPGFMSYWKRGVYVSISTETGLVTAITLAEPGKIEEPPAKSQG